MTPLDTKMRFAWNGKGFDFWGRVAENGGERAMKKAQTSVFCWPAIERMQQMHQLILNGEYPNCSTMAREFEMSVRTLKRNIDFMKTRMNLPIGFDVKRNGYYYTSAVPEFPRVPMSEADVFTMFVAKKAIEQYRGTPLQKMLEAVARKNFWRRVEGLPLSRLQPTWRAM